MQTISPKAFLFDLNGTMIDDMRFHLDVWYSILNEDLGANLTRDEVRSHMYGKNHEVLERIFGEGKFTLEEADRISKEKEDRYQDLYRPHLKLLPGLDDLLKKARNSSIKLAIGSAAIPYNIDFVIDTLSLRDYFEVIVSAEDVSRSKPDPETYLKAAEHLQVKPSSSIVFEDAPKGVEAAKNAGMKSVVITSMHEATEFAQYDNVMMFVEDYTDPRLNHLFEM
jgi:beta-phosphoglucomutase